MPNERIATALELRYVHLLLAQHMNDFGAFRVADRSEHIKFDETSPVVQMSIITDPQTGLSVGDDVNVHVSLNAPWSPELDARVTLRGPHQILAFVDLDAKCGRAKLSARFAILAPTNPRIGYRFETIDTERGAKAVALYFLNALEKVEW